MEGEKKSSSSRSSARDLSFTFGVKMIPHPKKAKTGGEDAFFIAANKKAFGLADGVGGWAKMGIDAGVYARKLMSEAKRAIEDSGCEVPLRILNEAYLNTRPIPGSSTAVVAVLDNKVLRTINLGDSGFRIFRREPATTLFKIVGKSKEQTHQFNTPYQLGHDSGDLPEHGKKKEFVMQAGDVIVAGTDGLFDNLFNAELADILTEFQKRHGNKDNASWTESADIMQQFADTLASKAFEASRQKVRTVPFGENAKKYGFRWTGGKKDDITVLVASCCYSPQQLRATSSPSSSPSPTRYSAKL